MDFEVVIREIMASPVVTLDFETINPEGNRRGGNGYEVAPRGLSAGWKVDGEIKSEYWSVDFGKSSTYNLVSWDWLDSNILRPLWNDKSKILVFHNAKYDILVAMRRLFHAPLPISEVPRALPKAKVFDTMTCAFLLDENYPRGLKEQVKYRFGKKRLTYAQTVGKCEEMTEDWENKIKDFTLLGWDIYKEKRQKSLNLEERLEGVAELERMALLQPRGLKKAEFLAGFAAAIRHKLGNKPQREADDLFAFYAKEDAYDTMTLYEYEVEELHKDQKLEDWYYSVELPFHLLQTEFEIGGVHLNTGFLRELLEAAEWLKSEMKSEVTTEAISVGMEENFNPNSHPQIKELLWKKLKLSPPTWAKPTKSGLMPSGDDVLEHLAGQGNEICRKLQDYSGVSHLISNFILPLLTRGERNPAHIVRTDFDSTGEITGRIKSRNPMLQNIPNADKMPLIPKSKYPEPPQPIWVEHPKKKDFWVLPAFRKAFTAPEYPGEDWVLIVTDLSQIELRYIAHITQDPELLKIYRIWECECGASGEGNTPLHECPVCHKPDGERDKSVPAQPIKHGFCYGYDAHARTAVNMGIVKDYSSFKEARSAAKPINFG